ncbi:tetratricopeptide repeat protein [bacterium]|nr:tetratricopeptide repeat protein [bacterium]
MILRPIPHPVILPALLLLAAAAFAPLSAAQTPRTVDPESPGLQLQPAPRPPRSADPHSLFDLRRRLLELDKLLSLGSIARAQALLDELSQHSLLQRDLVSRRIQLAQLQGDHEQAIAIAREALEISARNPGLWRSLAGSLLAAGRPDSARAAMERFITQSPNGRSSAVVAIEQCLDAGYPALAVGLIDSMRTQLGEPGFMARQMATVLLSLDRQDEAALQVSAELRSNPFNLSLVRTDLLDGLYDPVRHREFRDGIRARAQEPRAAAAEKVLAANMDLVQGAADLAWEQAAPLVANPATALLLMQNVATLNTELGLLPVDRQYQATIDYLLRVLEAFMGPDQPDALLRRRAADQLAEVCESALEAGSLGADPRAAADRFSALLRRVREINPSSERLYSSQIKLARYVRSELGDPSGAARSLERLLLDLDLPTEGIALARLTLGECYLAAGDTARGRTVLTQLGRDPHFREAGGFAHYHLARLDLAEGHYVTARDRFAVVAMDNPAASYSNDALELGLAIAEELDNPTGGPEIIGFYARAVMYDLVDRPSARLAALEDFVQEATLRVDPDAKQYLLERGLYELAGARAEAGDIEGARLALQTIYQEHADGRYAALAMAGEGALLMDAGRATEAQQVWNRLLAQYPDYLFIDDVRDELRKLP